MFAAAAADPSHPAVAALLGLGAAGLAGAVVAMAWNVHVRQIRLAERLTRREFMVAGKPARRMVRRTKVADRRPPTRPSGPTAPGKYRQWSLTGRTR